MVAVVGCDHGALDWACQSNSTAHRRCIRATLYYYLPSLSLTVSDSQGIDFVTENL